MSNEARKLLCVRVSEDERSELASGAAAFVRQPYWEGGPESSPGIDLSTFVRLISLALVKSFPHGLHQVDLDRLQLAPAKKVEASTRGKTPPRGGPKTHKRQPKAKAAVKRKAARRPSRKVAGASGKRQTRAVRRRAARVMRRAAAKATGYAR